MAVCVYGLPACYWLIDEGEEKDSVHQTKNREKDKQGNYRNRSFLDLESWRSLCSGGRGRGGGNAEGGLMKVGSRHSTTC